MATESVSEIYRELRGDTVMVVCNKEAGSFSNLWGRDCWVADSVLSLIQTHAEYIEDRGDTDAARQIVKYCKDLREKNRIGEFADTIDT